MDNCGSYMQRESMSGMGVSQSVRQALCILHFPNQTSLLASFFLLSKAFAFVCAHLLCLGSCTLLESPDYIFGAFKKPGRKLQVCKQAESEDVRTMR
jgi:hypothetical protein